jgi:hypothetical protein
MAKTADATRPGLVLAMGVVGTLLLAVGALAACKVRRP